jgi:hypothetical protein
MCSVLGAVELKLVYVLTLSFCAKIVGSVKRFSLSCCERQWSKKRSFTTSTVGLVGQVRRRRSQGLRRSGNFEGGRHRHHLQESAAQAKHFEGAQ